MMQGCGTKKREKEEEEKEKALPRGGKFLDAPSYLLLLDKSSLLCNMYNAYRINNITIMANTESSIHINTLFFF